MATERILPQEAGQVATERLPNRWIIAVAAVVMQICLGSTYAWSVFVKPLTATRAMESYTGLGDVLNCSAVFGMRMCDRRMVAGPERAADRLHSCGNFLWNWISDIGVGCVASYAARNLYRIWTV